MLRMRRMSLWHSTLLAFGAFLVVLGTAFGVMAGVGALIHALTPIHNFDPYAALHNEIVLLSLIGLSLLWLLPPHPWANELVEVPIRDDPEARFPEPVTGRARVAVLSVYRGRAPPEPCAVA